ncbi:hypothetical protein ONE63_003391 [Megalurothrips usitatus]|uniref:Ubiquitin-like protease family profile domain-containing protein n=1 Tax=Megalurothrips usitatus TaxID=439358 RepID=A0AAV7X7X0_9NEOP|nr:hypothetical protein ONE63_003391 [Megalurothrips usitatus]
MERTLNLQDSCVEAVQKNPSESKSAHSTPPRPDGNDANLPTAKHGKTRDFNSTLDSLIASINLSSLPNELNADSIDSVQEWFTHDVDVFFKSRSHVALADHHMTVNCCPVCTAQLLAFADDVSFRSLMDYCKMTSAFSADIWLWPLFDENRKHYTLLLEVMKHIVILYLDSKTNQYCTSKNEVIERLFKILCALYKDMYNHDSPSREWSIHIPEDVPQQSFSDCGPFICAWARSVCIVASPVPKTVGMQFGIRVYELSDYDYLHPAELIDSLVKNTEVAKAGAFVGRLRDAPSPCDVEDNIRHVKDLVKSDDKFDNFSPPLLKRQPLCADALLIQSTGEGQNRREKKFLKCLRENFRREVLDDSFTDSPKTKLEADLDDGVGPFLDSLHQTLKTEDHSSHIMCAQNMDMPSPLSTTKTVSMSNVSSFMKHLPGGRHVGIER